LSGPEPVFCTGENDPVFCTGENDPV